MKIIKSKISIIDDTNKKIKEKYNKNILYRHPGGNCIAFGDSLCWSSFISRLSLANNGYKIKIHKPSRRFKKIWSTGLLVNNGAQYENISDEETVNWYKENGLYKKIANWPEVYSYKFLPSYITYNINNVDNKKICYQFGKTGNKSRILKEGEELIILSFFIENGFTPISLGGHISDEENLKHASTCKFFIGTCSGMSHLCHAVGTPVNIICNDRRISKTKKFHTGNVRGFDTIFWKNIYDFMENFNQ